MTDITERQKKILEIVIKEHIDNAAPISSGFIEKKYNLGVSPATIRSDLFDLIEKGYLYQPHTSAGRIPTDKGYRFFVDLLERKEVKKLEYKLEEELMRVKKEMEGSLHYMRELTRLLAYTSSSLSVSYFPRENILMREGWGRVLEDPEFEDIRKVRSFMEMVDSFEENIDSFLNNKDENFIRIYIGSEAPFSKKYDFSVLISSCKIAKKKGLFAIIGPKRMPYEKNIYLVESIIKFIED